MKNEFILAFNEVIEEKQLPKEVVLEALQAAMVSAYRRTVNASNAQQIEASIDPETGKVKIFAEKEVVELVENSETEVSLQDARKVEEDTEIGNMVVVDSTPSNFGRVAAQTARQVIQQRIREAEREAQFDYYSKQLGEIISGVIQAVGGQGVTLGMEMKAEGIMPRNHQIPGERFRVHDRIRALLLEVKSTPRGPQIILSRAHRNFLRRLLENEVPEIYHGLVEIRSISREPGHRSKVAVAALQTGVDPVGACVGIRGVRIQAIVRELNDEKIDVIEWNTDPGVYIAKSLSPARVAGVYLDELNKRTKTATVVVPEDQLSLAIGRDGQNARLAAKLTGWRIDIKSLPEAATDALYKLQTDPEYGEIAKAESEVTPQIDLILAKKSEGRPITPEEYQVLTKLVDRVERGIVSQRQAAKQEKDEKEQEARAKIPIAAFDMPLEEFEIADRVYAVISEAGFPTVGDLMLQWEMDSDQILALKGMGPKGMKVLQETLENLDFPEEEPEVEEEPVSEVQEAESGAEVEGEVSEAVEVTEETEAVIEVETEETEQAQDGEAGEPLPEIPTALEEGVDIEEIKPPEDLEEVKEETSALEEIFKLGPEVLDFDIAEDSEFEDDAEEKAKKKKKKKLYIEVEYDPDQDATIVKKKRKRGEDDWEEKWDL
jgi:N utilization substance protein A